MSGRKAPEHGETPNPNALLWADARLLRGHRPAGAAPRPQTKAGCWGVIHVLEGALAYWITDPRRPGSEEVLASGGAPGVTEGRARYMSEIASSFRFDPHQCCDPYRGAIE
ncbi:MAG: DUF1971 domain-containing protein [Stellaceae bacterium]